MELAVSDEESPVTHPDLALLISKVADQDSTSFARLFVMIAPRIKRYMLLQKTGDALAEELTQETMLTVWRKASQFDRAAGSAEGWIFAIARNLRVDIARRGRTNNVLFEGSETESGEPSPEQHLLSRERFGLIETALLSLSPAQQTVLRAALLHDRPLTQIADELGLPLSTTKSHLRRGLVKLRELIGFPDQ